MSAERELVLSAPAPPHASYQLSNLHPTMDSKDGECLFYFIPFAGGCVLHDLAKPYQHCQMTLSQSEGEIIC